VVQELCLVFKAAAPCHTPMTYLVLSYSHSKTLSSQQVVEAPVVISNTPP